VCSRIVFCLRCLLFKLYVLKLYVFELYAFELHVYYCALFIIVRCLFLFVVYSFSLFILFRCLFLFAVYYFPFLLVFILARCLFLFESITWSIDQCFSCLFLLAVVLPKWCGSLRVYVLTTRQNRRCHIIWTKGVVTFMWFDVWPPLFKLYGSVYFVLWSRHRHEVNHITSAKPQPTKTNTKNIDRLIKWSIQTRINNEQE
jgi:hypothetical protein